MAGAIQIPDLPLLEEEETRILLAEAQKGNEAAREKLARHNLKLVMKVVYRFRDSGYDLEELFQVGCIGLIKAINNFDLSREARLSTYALPRIIGEIRSFLRDDSPIKMSRDSKRKGSELKRLAGELALQLGREPTMKELSDAAEIPIPELVEILEAMKNPLSLEMPVNNTGQKEITLSQQIADEHQPGELFHLDLLQLRQV
ncbi:MAG: sigma-70 family RNA polymerase sigma factor, partial [Halanaerobium sp.]|nr:sigma-70 family RNA polymerase sigma factor [Halanaerobium sp.]